MGEYRRQVGQALMLNLSLDDGNASRFVRAYLYDKLGAPLPTPFVNLSHIGSGVYIENATAMPNTDQVKTKYFVYLDAGYSVLDPCHLGGFDTFDKEELVPMSFPDDTLVGVIESNGPLVGSIPSAVIAGAVESDEVAGSVEGSLAIGEISSDVSTGVVTESDVTGTIKDC